MHLKSLLLSCLALLVCACQQSPVALGNDSPFGTSSQQQGLSYPRGANAPAQDEYIITEREGDASQNRFSGFGRNVFGGFEQAPSQLQQQSFGFFNRFSSGGETKVAFLVPLSGKFKELGENMLNSAEMALFFLNDPNVSLMPIDTKGTPFGAKEAAEEALARGAKLILGPVFSRSAKSAITATEGSDVHVISFSNDKTLADSGVFTIGFRPEQEIERIISYARDQGITDYTAVLPNNNYGASAAETLRLSVEDEGHSILRSEIYYVDAKGNAKNLYNHTINAMNAALKTRPERDYITEEKRFSDEPIVYPRGMLVPEGGVRLKEVLSNLSRSGRFDSEKVRLLGTSLWSEELPEDDLLNGAWFAAADVNKHQSFEAHFQEVYGKQPPSIASLAYDGVALAVALSRMSGGNDFSREALTNPRGFVGVDGIFRLEPNGLTSRGLAIMQVQNGRAVIIDPAPQRFTDM